MERKKRTSRLNELFYREFIFENYHRCFRFLSREERKYRIISEIFAMVYAFISRYKKIIRRRKFETMIVYLLIYQTRYPEIYYYISSRLYKNIYIYKIYFHSSSIFVKFYLLFSVLLFTFNFRISAIIKLITII